jgi:hypothetical protein
MTQCPNDPNVYLMVLFHVCIGEILAIIWLRVLGTGLLNHPVRLFP